MPQKSPGARARALGAQLRDCRDECGMTVRAAAESVGWDKSTLSRMETGARQPALEEVAQLLGVYRVVGELRDEVFQMARAVDEPGWWNHGDRGLARATTALASYETEAMRVTDWASLIIPGLLQTADYARSCRIVPCNTRPHRGQICAFHQMDFADTPPVVLVELLRSSLFMDEPWQTTPYLEAVTQLANVALGETESIRLITYMQARWSDHERAGAVV